MPSVLPPQFLFRFSFPVRRIADGVAGEPPRLPEEFRLPDVGPLEGARSFGDVRIGWSPQGLGVSLLVRGKRMPLNCNPTAPLESDGLQVWIDTRNTQSVHRATRFCHHFCLLPAGGGRQGREPVAAQFAILRAREDVPGARPRELAVRCEPLPDGYRLDAWIPADSLTGFDPEASPRLGFYYSLRDAELGEQHLTVGRDFPFAYDPSLWSTLDLSDDPADR